MYQAFANIFRIADLRSRVLFTLGMLAIYRIGFWIPLPGVDQTELAKQAQAALKGGESGSDVTSVFSAISNYASIFSGGSLSHSTLFGLGIMPYITASIIFQLLQSVVPALQELKKEGASGQQKVMEWTRYATVALCIGQGFMWLNYMRENGIVQPQFLVGTNLVVFYLSGIVGLTAGSLFLMWLGEQIDKYGIGNGVSLILTCGILARMPAAVEWVVQNFSLSQQADVTGGIGIGGLATLIAFFVLITAGAIIITVAQRRIPIQQAKHTRGRKVFGGQKHYLPLRLNHAGVMPIIFASSLMIFPTAIFGYLATRAGMNAAPDWWINTTTFLATNFQIGAFPHLFCELLLIYFFSYFWTTVQFSPDDMAKQLKEHGSFIPGLRPGPRTAEYLETVMERITFVGAGFLAVIALIPTIVSTYLGIPFQVSQFLGGTGLLIVVSVGLDLIQRIEANLLMRNYSGFLSSGPNDRAAPRVRSGRN